MTIYSDTVHLSDILLYRDLMVTLLDLITDFGLFTEFREVSIEHMQRVWHANRGRLLLRAPGPVPLYDLHVF